MPTDYPETSPRTKRRTEPPTVTYVQAPGVSEDEANAMMADLWTMIMGPSDEEWARRHNLPWPPCQRTQDARDTATSNSDGDRGRS